MITDRYYIHYRGSYKRVMDRIDQFSGFTRKRHNVHNNELFSPPENNDVVIDGFADVIDIAMDDKELNWVKMNISGIVINPKGVDSGSKLLHDPDGVDNGRARGSEYCNQWSTVDGISDGFSFGSRVETYTNSAAVNTYDVNGFSVITGELRPTMIDHFGIDVLWAQGYKGAGVKIGILDEGYSNAQQHPKIGAVAGCYNFYSPNNIETNTSEHATERLGDCAAAHTGSGIMGIAPEATYYTANFNASPQSLSWLIQQGCMIINCSYTYTNTNSYFNSLVKMLRANGGMVVFAAGNELPPAMDPIQDAAAIPGVSGIGSCAGNLIYKPNAEILVYRNVTPAYNKSLSFLMFFANTSAGFESGNINTPSNTYSRGSSVSASLYTGMMAVLKCKFPSKPLRIIEREIEISASITSAGLLFPVLTHLLPPL